MIITEKYGFLSRKFAIVFAVLMMPFLSGCFLSDYEAGKRHLANERWDEARLCFLRAHEKGEEQVALHYFLAQAQSRTGDHGSAWRSYEKFLEMGGEQAEPIKGEILSRIRGEKIEEAMAIGEAGDEDGAVELLIHIDPDKSQILLGDLALRIGNLEKARGQYLNAYAVRGREDDSSFIAELHLAMARLYRQFWKRDGDINQFYKVFRELRLAKFMAHPDPNFYAYIDVLYQDLRKQPEFEKYAPVFDAYNQLNIEENRGDYQNAAKTAQKIIMLSPLFDDQFYAFHKLGDLMMALGDYRQAYESYQRALSLAGAIKDISVAGLHDKIGLAAEALSIMGQKEDGVTKESDIKGQSENEK